MVVSLLIQGDLEANLRFIGTQIREFIESTPPNTRPERLITYPLGSCGDTAMIMGTYLIKKGFLDVEYVVGKDGDQSHAWLECDGFIVDLTADQFGGDIERVIVTRSRHWHSDFENQERKSCDFRDYQDPTIYELYDFSEIMTQSMLAR